MSIEPQFLFRKVIVALTAIATIATIATIAAMSAMRCTNGRCVLSLAALALGLQLASCAEPPAKALNAPAERPAAPSTTPPKAEAPLEPEGHWCDMRTRVCH